MSMLTREQVIQRAEILKGYLSGDVFDNVDLIVTTDAALRAEVAHLTQDRRRLIKANEHWHSRVTQLKDEVQHWREACESVGETDGHGWAETTKELRAEVAQWMQREEAGHRAKKLYLECCEKIARLQPKWTTEKPTKPGWYWWQASGITPSAALIYDDGNENGWLECDGVPIEEWERHTGCSNVEWSGPIQPPQEGVEKNSSKNYGIYSHETERDLSENYERPQEGGAR